MVKREITSKILELIKKFPVVTLTGPRQSGKTTLLKNILPGFEYVSLEDPENRLLAINDPKSFLRQYKSGVIIDEAQIAPDLFSYIQVLVDERGTNGQFVLSGSQSFLLHHKISQSLAGRTAIFRLFPFNMPELKRAGVPFDDYENIIYNGCFPRLYDHAIDPADFYPGYIQTYVERDVRQLQNIKDLNSFTRFIKLCAGRIGQLLEFTSLANDCGISVNTAKSWISLLEASYIVNLLQPHHKNFNKRLVKMPKLYFSDTGLACSLLNIESPAQLSTHYLKGNLFENFIVLELIKHKLNNGSMPNCYFWRDSKKKEIDCIIEKGAQLLPVEIKSGRTFTYGYFDGINYWNKISGGKPENSFVIYGGEKNQQLKDGKLLSWKNLNKLLERT